MFMCEKEPPRETPVHALITSTTVVVSMLFCSGVSAKQLPPPVNADMPIAFASTVTDVCFQMAYNNTLSTPIHSTLDPLSHAPIEVNGMYPLVPTWYRLKKEPRNVFVGIGDKQNVCHVVLTNTKDGRQSFNALLTLLRATGFTGGWDARGSALSVMTKKWGAGNLVLILKGLTNPMDGIGPQVSVDVGSLSDDKLKQLLEGR